MNEPFNLPINYQGEELELKARFERWGYTHRMAVLIGETTVTFEPDEEGGTGRWVAAGWKPVCCRRSPRNYSSLADHHLK
ncbi:hypothetical protein LX99_04529 [Mucilaginibacter oryzae]|uniref:Uncharacterized protein n=2 Tax=Mucilaginibacter oryzae TaxID=468058 RepID=A0A316H1M1_9SPHI|nr:hypothetical protein LX99_04529 [Mucilaginibacter oryzae]